MNVTPTLTLVKKELTRFIRTPGQTIGAPVITTFLFLLVFGASLGASIGKFDGLSYMEFIIPGLIMMNVLTSSFLGVASAILLAKIMNTFADILIAPMSYLEVALGITVASVVRSIVVGVLIYGTALIFVSAHIVHPFYLATFFIIVAFTFAFLGLIAGIVSDNFEQMSILPAFLITPLSFLGGVFYSVNTLPPFFRALSKFNPFLYLINGMRYGFYGVSDVEPMLAYLIALGFFIVLVIATWYLFRTGYKIRP